MKNILNKYVYLSLFLALSLVISSCSEDDNESDVSKVIPLISNVDGVTVAFVGETYIYTLSPYRGGSVYNWNITGAEMAPVDGRPDQVSVTFNQFNQPASIAVQEVASNGSSSNTMTVDVIVFGTPCNWTIDLQDAWGDGWNGASISFSVAGIDFGAYTLGDGLTDTQYVAIPDGGNVDVSFNAGEYDGEVSYQIYDATGTLVAEKFAYGAEATGVIYSGLNACP
jgi:hypothetical protein